MVASKGRGFDQPLGEIRGRGDQHKAFDPVWPRQGRQAGKPAAHGRADQDQRAIGEFINHRQRVGAPAGDGSLPEIPRRGAVAEIVEAEERAALFHRPIGQGLSLGSGHFRAKPAQPNQGRAGAVHPSPSQALAISFPVAGLFRHEPFLAPEPSRAIYLTAEAAMQRA
jgi:hypothetical protein